MKKLTACVREKGSKDYMLITSKYPSKKAFYDDLRANGYCVRSIYTEEQFNNL